MHIATLLYVILLICNTPILIWVHEIGLVMCMVYVQNKSWSTTDILSSDFLFFSPVWTVWCQMWRSMVHVAAKSSLFFALKPCVLLTFRVFLLYLWQLRLQLRQLGLESLVERGLSLVTFFPQTLCERKEFFFKNGYCFFGSLEVVARFARLSSHLTLC